MRNLDRLPTACQKTEPLHTSCLRKLLKWQDRIPDTEVLKRAGVQSVHIFLKLAQLRWTGHVTRMPDERLPKKILYGELQVGKRSQGGQKERYKDTLKKVREKSRECHNHKPQPPPPPPTPNPPLMTLTHQQSRGNRLHRIEQSGEAS